MRSERYRAVIMPRYFFNVRRDGRIAADPEGMELPSSQDAAAEALRNARDLMSELLKGDAALGLDDSIHVTDEDGIVICTVTFKEALGQH